MIMYLYDQSENMKTPDSNEFKSKLVLDSFKITLEQGVFNNVTLCVPEYAEFSGNGCADMLCLCRIYV